MLSWLVSLLSLNNEWIGPSFATTSSSLSSSRFSSRMERLNVVLLPLEEEEDALESSCHLYFKSKNKYFTVAESTNTQIGCKWKKYLSGFSGAIWPVRDRDYFSSAISRTGIGTGREGLKLYIKVRYNKLINRIITHAKITKKQLVCYLYNLCRFCIKIQE